MHPQVFPNELEAQREFEGFTEWLQTFDLYRGKQTEEEFEDDGRVVGKFKGSLKIYKLPLPKDLDDHTVMGFDPQYGFFQVTDDSNVTDRSESLHSAHNFDLTGPPL